MMTATNAVTAPNTFWTVDCASICAVTPPSRLPPAVATSRTMPRRMLIKCLPVRPAETELDVAITVVRLIAAATVNGKLRPRLRNGTRNTPPPMPRRAPRPPATAPAAKMIRASAGVTIGIRTKPPPRSRRELSRLCQIPRGLFDRARLGLLACRPVGARESRAGVDIRDGAVIHVAQLVGFDRHRPTSQLLLAARVFFWFHDHQRLNAKLAELAKPIFVSAGSA